MKINHSRRSLYVILALSPILLLSGCKPFDWLKEKIGMGKKDESVVTGASVMTPAQSGGDWVVKVGDKVLYGKYSGTEITLEGETYLIMKESDILAVM